jgi:hypothetical protein
MLHLVGLNNVIEIRPRLAGKSAFCLAVDPPCQILSPLSISGPVSVMKFRSIGAQFVGWICVRFEQHLMTFLGYDLPS